MEIIHSLLKNNINRLIYEDELEKNLFIENAKNAGIECISVLDSRSAVYYATGICAQNKEIVAVCINSVNSRSAFSGMTEAYYRKLPVILITLGDTLDYSKELNDVVVNHYVISRNEDLNGICMSEFPVHIEITNVINNVTRTECNHLLSILANVLNVDDYLYISQKIIYEKFEFACKVVKGGMTNSIDGTLSNVLGASLAQKRRRYLGLITEKEFLHDINVLGNVNMNDLVLYFIVVKNKNQVIYDYAKSLGFEVVINKIDLINETDILKILNNGKKTIYMVCEDA